MLSNRPHHLPQEVGLPDIEAIRRFNRFYTKQIGVLHEGLLQSSFSLVEARVIYELARHNQVTATGLCDELGIDPGYLSRILQGFKKRNLVVSTPSPTDKRQQLLTLSAEGQSEFSALNNHSRQEIRELLNTHSAINRTRLVTAMATIEELLGQSENERVPYILRPPQPGDMGWVIYRHAFLYAAEYGWDAQFEVLVAEIVNHILQNFDLEREQCWIAEKDGKNVGSVFVVRQSDEIAKLRLLLVEPEARGLGIGARLVDECIRFARQKGYKKLLLWTNSILIGARRIYERAGFVLMKTEAHYSFGHNLIGETWELTL